MKKPAYPGRAGLSALRGNTPQRDHIWSIIT